MIELSETDVIVISGKRGSGKTYLSNWIIQNLIDAEYDVQIMDINNEYDIEGAEILRFRDLVDFRTRFNAIVDNARKQGKFLIIDDADIIIDERRIPDALLTDLQIGRHNDSGLMLLFRRMNTIHKQVLFNANHFFIFKSKLLVDREYFNKNLSSGFDIVNLGKYEFYYMDNLSDDGFVAKLHNNDLEIIHNISKSGVVND